MLSDEMSASGITILGAFPFPLGIDLKMLKINILLKLKVHLYFLGSDLVIAKTICSIVFKLCAICQPTVLSETKLFLFSSKPV